MVWNNSSTTSITTTQDIPPGFTWDQPLSISVTKSNWNFATGRHLYSMTVELLNASNQPIYTVVSNGHTFVYNDTTDLLGDGWSFGWVNRLIQVNAANGLPAGKMMVFGTGGVRFYESTGSGYLSPLGDRGTLSANALVYTTGTGEKYTFNATGYQTGWTSADGLKTISFTYNSSNRLTGVTWSDGTISTFTYYSPTSNVFRLSSIQVKSPGSTQTVSYGLSYYPSSGSYRLKNVSNPDGGYWTFNYTSGRLTEQITSGQPMGVNNTAHLTAEGHLYSSWLYDSYGLVTGFQQGRSGTAIYSIVPLASLGLMGLHIGETKTTVTNPENKITTYWLDAYANGLGTGSRGIITRINRPDQASNQYWEWEFDPRTNAILSQTDGVGVTTTYENDSKGYPVTILHPEKYLSFPAGYQRLVERYEYTDINNRHVPTRYIEQTLFSPNFGNGYEVVRQKITEYSYDPVTGNLTKVRENTSANNTTVAREWKYGWTNGNLTGIEEPQGSNTQFTYDGYRRVTSLTQAVPQYGNLTTPTTILNVTWLFAYDGFNNVVNIIDPNLKATTINYDRMHRSTVAYLPSPAGSYLPGQATPISETEYYPSGLIKSSRAPVSSGSDVYATQYRYVYNNTATGEVGRGLATKVVEENRSFTINAGAYQWSSSPLALRETIYAYNGIGKPSAVTDYRGNTTTLQYSPVGRLETLTYPNNLGVISQGHDANGRFTGYTTFDPIQQTSRQVVYDYDEIGRIASVVNGIPGMPDTASTTYSYNDRDLKVFITNPRNFTSTVGLDNFGRATKFWKDAAPTAGSEIVTIGYTGGDMPYSITEHDRQLTTINHYDVLSRPLNGYRYRNEPGSYVSQSLYKYDYDKLGNITKSTNAFGVEDVFTYDNWSRLTTATLANNYPTLKQTSSFQYDYQSKVTTVTDALNLVTQYSYDSMYRLSRITELPGTSLERSTSFVSYDNNDNLLSYEDILGRTTSYTFDQLNRVASITYPDPDSTGPLPAPSVQYVYNGHGDVKSITDHLGRKTVYGYDDLGRSKTVTEAAHSPTLSRTTTFGYDKNSNLTTVTPPAGAPVTQYTYDYLDRLENVTEGFGSSAPRTTNYIYSLNTGLLSSIQAPNSATTTFGYDPLNRRNQITDARGAVTKWTFDNLDRVQSIEDPNHNFVSYGYDALNRVITERTHATGYADLGTRGYGYDAGNRQTSSTDRTGKQITWDYDNLDRLLSETWSNSTYVATYGYSDNSNRVTSLTDPNSSFTFGYDQLDRVTESTVSYTGLSQPQRSVNTFDPAGRLQRIEQGPVVGGTFQPHTATIYGFDDLDRTTSVRQENPTRWMQADYLYNSLDQVTSRSTNSGLLGQAGGTPIVATYSYTDPLKRLTNIGYTQGSTSLGSYGLTYTPNTDWIQAETSSDGTISYGYDLIGQLTDVTYSDPLRTTEHYDYDLNGNRTGAGYVVGPYNRMLASPGYTYEYNAENQRTKRTNTSSNAVNNYTWDHHGRLTSTSGTISSTEWFSNEYQYDALDNKIGNRSIVTSWPIGQPLPTQTINQTWFGLDGNEVRYQMDASGTVATRQFHGAGLDEVLAEDRGAGPRWSLTDVRGSVRQVVDSAGTNLSTGKYTGFGKAVQAADSFFSFTGLETEALSGLQYNRARWYDSNAGRFLSEDPLGLGAGDANLSRYTGNDPVNYTDPSGLLRVLPIDTPGTGGGGVGGASQPGKPAVVPADSGRRLNPASSHDGKGQGINVGGTGVPSEQQAGIVEDWVATPAPGLTMLQPRNDPAEAERVRGYANEPNRVWENNNSGLLGARNVLNFVGEVMSFPVHAFHAGVEAARFVKNYGGIVFIDPLVTGLSGVLVASGLPEAGLWMLDNLLVSDITRQGNQSFKNGESLGTVMGRAYVSAGQDAASMVLNFFPAGRAITLGTALGQIFTGNLDEAGKNLGQLAAGGFLQWMFCFVAGTPVSTERGLRPIETIETGTKVWSYDFSDGKWKLRPVEETMKRWYEGDFVTIQVQGDEITSTGDHPFWVIEGEKLAERRKPAHVPVDEPGNIGTPGRWVDARDLKVGDVFLRHNGKPGRVESLAARQEGSWVYNLHVDELNNFAVGNGTWLVHNRSSPEWNKARRKYWKDRAQNALDGEFSPSNLDRMKKGLAPKHDALGVSKELHHKIPQREGGANDASNLKEVWPWEHAAIDPYRHYKGTIPNGE